MICSFHQIFVLSNQEECDGLGMWHVLGSGMVSTVFL